MGAMSQNAFIPARPPVRAAGCTGQSRPSGDHDHGANVSRASKEGTSRSVLREHVSCNSERNR